MRKKEVEEGLADEWPTTSLPSKVGSEHKGWDHDGDP